jgi:RNA polymerase sigma-70 factor (ECF subfamily)
VKGGKASGHLPGEGERLPDSPHDRIDAQALFRAHARFVASFLRRLGAPYDDIDDLVQEVFLVAHRKGGFVPGSGAPRSWLGAIALRVASGHRRSRNRRHEEPGEAAVSAAVAPSDVAAALEAQQALRCVQRALDTLDLEHRAAFVLYEFEDESCESIAASQGIPVGTVYSRLHHARRRFLEAFAAMENGKAAAARQRLAGGA